MVNGAMFKFAISRQVLWPVVVRIPRDDGTGEAIEAQIKIRYRLLTQTELTARARDDLETARAVGSDQAGVDGLLEQISPERVDRRLQEMKGRITGWEDFADEQGEPLPFTAENLAAVLDVPYLRAPIERGLIEASQGARAKNLSPGSAG